MHLALLDVSVVATALLLFSSTTRAEKRPPDPFTEIVPLPTEPGQPAPPDLADYREFLATPADQGPRGNQYDLFAKCLAGYFHAMKYNLGNEQDRTLQKPFKPCYPRFEDHMFDCFRDSGGRGSNYDDVGVENYERAILIRDYWEAFERCVRTKQKPRVRCAPDEIALPSWKETNECLAESMYRLPPSIVPEEAKTEEEGVRKKEAGSEPMSMRRLTPNQVRNMAFAAQQRGKEAVDDFQKSARLAASSWRLNQARPLPGWFQPAGRVPAFAPV
ncbi:MAG: hypothetical protein M1823_005315 [Watsoniomyces obsoletus]|nr:MAG: hypothetical protein M1823_005315 [Watsoniomyces obsoletus]